MAVVEFRRGLQPDVATVTDFLMSKVAAARIFWLGAGVIENEDEISGVVSHRFHFINDHIGTIQHREDCRDLDLEAD